MAVSGRFMTKAEILCRGAWSAVSDALLPAIIPSSVCELSFLRRTSFSLVRLILGPAKAVKGSSNDRRTTERMKSRPSSQKTRT